MAHEQIAFARFHSATVLIVPALQPVLVGPRARFIRQYCRIQATQQENGTTYGVENANLSLLSEEPGVEVLKKLAVLPALNRPVVDLGDLPPFALGRGVRQASQPDPARGEVNRVGMLGLENGEQAFKFGGR